MILGLDLIIIYLSFFYELIQIQLSSYKYLISCLEIKRELIYFSNDKFLL